MTLSRQDALRFWVYQNTSWLCGKPLLWDGERLKVEMDSGSADLYAWSEREKAFVLHRHLESGLRHEPVSWQQVGSGRYVVDLPAGHLTGHKQVLLRVRYRGDIGNAFAGNELISDNFCNGDAWDLRVDCYAEILKAQPLVLYLTPAKENVTVDASAMAGLQEKADMKAAELLSAELVTVDDFVIQEE